MSQHRDGRLAAATGAASSHPPTAACAAAVWHNAVVAVKVINVCSRQRVSTPQGAADDLVCQLQRHEAESHLNANLRHPNIVQVGAAGGALRGAACLAVAITAHPLWKPVPPCVPPRSHPLQLFTACSVYLARPACLLDCSFCSCSPPLPWPSRRPWMNRQRSPMPWAWRPQQMGCPPPHRPWQRRQRPRCAGAATWSWRCATWAPCRRVGVAGDPGSSGVFRLLHTGQLQPSRHLPHDFWEAVAAATGCIQRLLLCVLLQALDSGLLTGPSQLRTLRAGSPPGRCVHRRRPAGVRPAPGLRAGHRQGGVLRGQLLPQHGRRAR